MDIIDKTDNNNNISIDDINNNNNNNNNDYMKISSNYLTDQQPQQPRQETARSNNSITNINQPLSFTMQRPTSATNNGFGVVGNSVLDDSQHSRLLSRPQTSAAGGERYNSGDSGMVAIFFKYLYDSESNRLEKIRAATTIAKHWKGYCVRKRYINFRDGVIRIQSAIRASLARRQLLMLIHAQRSVQQHGFFEEKATQIQRIWRGYASRKFQVNFYERRRYLKQLSEKTESTVQAMMEYEQMWIDIYKNLSKSKKENEIFKAAARSHYLLGTKTTPGVYSKITGPTPTNPFGINDETIKDAFQKQYQQEHIINNTKIRGASS